MIFDCNVKLGQMPSCLGEFVNFIPVTCYSELNGRSAGKVADYNNKVGAMQYMIFW